MNKVHGVMLSPFVRKVLLTLEYKNVHYDNIMVLPGSHSAEFRAISPLGKIPVLEDEYGALPDSTIICQYLDSKYPRPSILPACPKERAQALWLEEFADSKLAELLGGGIFFESLVAPRLMNRATDEKVVAQAKQALPPYFDYLEKQLTCCDYLVGNSITIADLTLPNFFINASYAGYEVDSKHWPKLANYINNMLQHPLYVHRMAQEKDIVAGLMG